MPVLICVVLDSKVYLAQKSFQEWWLTLFPPPLATNNTLQSEYPRFNSCLINNRTILHSFFYPFIYKMETVQWIWTYAHVQYNESGHTHVQYNESGYTHVRIRYTRICHIPYWLRYFSTGRVWVMTLYFDDFRIKIPVIGKSIMALMGMPSLQVTIQDLYLQACQINQWQYCLVAMPWERIKSQVLRWAAGMPHLKMPHHLVVSNFLMPVATPIQSIFVSDLYQIVTLSLLLKMMGSFMGDLAIFASSL